MIRQVRRPGEDVLERELFVFLLVLARVVGRIEVVLEVGVEVDLVEGVLLLLRRGRVGRCRLLGRRPRVFAASPLRRLLVLFLLFEERVFDHLLGEDFLELEPGHLQQLDRLLQRRRHDQSLGESEVEFLFEAMVP